MTTKTFHGFTLWAVPRFHRSEAIRSIPFRDEPARADKRSNLPQEKPAETGHDNRAPLALTSPIRTCH